LRTKSVPVLPICFPVSGKQTTAVALTLPKGTAEKIYFDGDIPGFGLRLRAGGSKIWIYQYRHGATQRRMKLGKLGAVSAPRAREMAAELYAKVQLGADPVGDRAEERVRAAETLGATLDRYLAFSATRLRPRSLIEVTRHLRKHCRPLHGLRLDKIDRRAIAQRITTLAANNGAVTANRVAASLSAFFSWCIREGLAAGNPAAGLNRQPERSRVRVLTDSELKAIWAATADASDYSAVVRLLMCSGQRAAEIAGLRWSEIVGDQIVLPSDRTKNGREHRVPITDAMRAILDARPRRSGRDLIFGRRFDVPLRGWGVLKAGLDARLGESAAAFVHHDFRRTCATRLADLDIAPHVIEAVLNHVSGHKAGVAGIYNRSTLEPQKRHALIAWNARLLTIVAGRTAPDKVVSLRA
jgi:integrase